MDYQTFLQKLKASGIEYQSDMEYGKTAKGRQSVRMHEIPGTEKISVEWRIGGRSGGSIYEDARYYKDAEDEPEFNVLDQILELICPNISFLQYKNISNQSIVKGEYRDDDYYGNYTDYKTKTIVLKNLFDILDRKNLLSE